LTPAEITTDGHLFLHVHEDASGRASIRTFSTTGANIPVNAHESHGVFSDECTDRAGFHAWRFFTLLANKRKGFYQTVSLPPYYTDGGSLRIALAEMIKRAYHFTFFTACANLIIH
jgi:hypothetical protein